MATLIRVIRRPKPDSLVTDSRDIDASISSHINAHSSRSGLNHPATLSSPSLVVPEHEPTDSPGEISISSPVIACANSPRDSLPQETLEYASLPSYKQIGPARENLKQDSAPRSVVDCPSSINNEPKNFTIDTGTAYISSLPCHTDHTSASRSPKAQVTDRADSILSIDGTPTPTTDLSFTQSLMTAFSSKSQSTLEYTFPVTLPSHMVFQVGKRLYQGSIKDIPVPSDLHVRWVESIRPRITDDVLPILAELRRPGRRFEPDFCMMGRTKRGDTSVKLRPTVCIRCGNKKAAKVVKDAIKDLAYLNAFSRGFVEVFVGPPELSNSDSLEILEPLTLTDNDCMIGHLDYRIHVHLETPSEHRSVCGLKLLVTATRNDNIVAQRISTLGGFVFTNNKVLGLTTAHTILRFVDEILESLAENDETNSTDSTDEFSSDSDGQTKETELLSPIDSVQRIPLSDHDENDREHKMWSRVSGLALAVFDGANTTRSPAADFALIQVEGHDDALLGNTYKDPSSGHIKTVSRYEPESALHEGKVYILLSTGQPKEGYLLPHPSMMVVDRIVLDTRKIQLDSPLSKGCSGAWVVRGNVLYGVIVAVYRNEPYAHMITAERMFTNIKSIYTPVDTVKVATQENIKNFMQTRRNTSIASKAMQSRCMENDTEPSEKVSMTYDPPLEASVEEPIMAEPEKTAPAAGSEQDSPTQVAANSVQYLQVGRDIHIRAPELVERGLSDDELYYRDRQEALYYRLIRSAPWLQEGFRLILLFFAAMIAWAKALIRKCF